MHSFDGVGFYSIGFLTSGGGGGGAVVEALVFPRRAGTQASLEPCHEYVW